jgi:hypothetical protein
MTDGEEDHLEDDEVSAMTLAQLVAGEDDEAGAGAEDDGDDA